MTSLDLPKRPRFVDFDSRPFSLDEMRHLASLPSIVRLDFKNCPVGDDHIRLICSLPKLESLWLEGTQVTDAVLAEIAKLPKLNWLILDRTVITGSGFEHFSGHPALKILWLSAALVDDHAVPFIARIPSLATLVIKDTKVTFAGLLALASSPLVNVNAGTQFSRSEIARFEIAQLQAASRTPAGFEPPEGDLEASRTVLESFFEAMAAWELEAAQSGSPQSGSQDWKLSRCAEIFAKFCTPKDRKQGRPNVLFYAQPPEYSEQTPLHTEWLSPRNVVFYTKDRNGTKHRYLLVKTTANGSWTTRNPSFKDGPKIISESKGISLRSFAVNNTCFAFRRAHRARRGDRLLTAPTPATQTAPAYETSHATPD